MGRRWVEYQSVRNRQNDDRLHVTVNARGNIYFSRRALEALQMPEAVVLLFDIENKTIGVRRASVERRNSHQLTKKDSKGHGRILYAADFLAHYGVRVTETLTFTSPELDDDGILVLSLKEAVAVGKRKVAA